MDAFTETEQGVGTDLQTSRRLERRDWEDDQDGRLLVRPERAADMLDISRSMVYRLLAEGRLPSVVIGRSRRVPVDALRRWIAEQAA